jgi:hypothetical protein
LSQNKPTTTTTTILSLKSSSLFGLEKKKKKENQKNGPGGDRTRDIHMTSAISIPKGQRYKSGALPLRHGTLTNHFHLFEIINV